MMAHILATKTAVCENSCTFQVASGTSPCNEIAAAQIGGSKGSQNTEAHWAKPGDEAQVEVACKEVKGRLYMWAKRPKKRNWHVLP